MSKDIISRNEDTFRTGEIKDLVKMIEKLPSTELIRKALEDSGVLNNPYMLAEFIDGSIGGSSNDSLSLILDSLKPTEIQLAMYHSEQVFQTQDLISNDDKKQNRSWYILTKEKFEDIKKNGTKEEISRLAIRKNPNTGNKTEYVLLKDEIKIDTDQIYFWFQAIINSSNTDEWKNSILEEFDINSLACAAENNYEIIEELKRNFPHIHDRLLHVIKQGKYRENAIDNCFESRINSLASITNITKESVSDIILGKKDTQGNYSEAIKDLKTFGGLTQEDIQAGKDYEALIDELYKRGEVE